MGRYDPKVSLAGVPCKAGRLNWLPYGSADASVVVQDPLTSVLTAAPNGAWSGFALQGSGLPPMVDPVLGTIFRDVNGAEAGYRFGTMTSILDGIDEEGQISVQLERDYVCEDDPTNGSYGDTLGALDAAISTLATASPGGTSCILLNAAGATGLRSSSYGATGPFLNRKDYRNHVVGADAQAVLYTGSKERFVTVNIGWKAPYAWIAVDGVIVNATDLYDASGWTDIWNLFYLGSDRGVADRFMDAHYMRNFQIANVAPSFGYSHAAGTIGVLSDSIFDSEPVSAATAGDLSAQFRIQRMLERNGIWGKIQISENSGAHCYDNGGVYIGDAMAAWQAFNATIGVLVIGVNDAITSGALATAEQFETAIKSHLTTMLATANKVVVPNIIPMYGVVNNPNYANYVANAAVFRIVIDGLTEWNPNVVIADVFTAMGKESPAYDNLYKGQLAGTGTDVHLASRGMEIFGDTIAAKIEEIL